MDLRLAGKRALVTGSSAGLGEAIAKFLAAEGAAVVVHGRDVGRTNAVAQAIRAAGGRAEIAIGDLSTDRGADAVVSAAQAGGGIDILVNNAGAYHHLSWMEATPDRWIETYQSNVVSCVRMIHRLVPGMKDRRWGRVIQIGGGLAVQPIPMQPDYEASLAARHNLAVSLARELKDTRVTSNVVAPGAIRVPSVEELLVEVAPRFGWGDSWEEIERGCVRDMVPNDVGRLGRPEEIAAAVGYLASCHADYGGLELFSEMRGTERAAEMRDEIDAGGFGSAMVALAVDFVFAAKPGDARHSDRAAPDRRVQEPRSDRPAERSYRR